MKKTAIFFTCALMLTAFFTSSACSKSAKKTKNKKNTAPTETRVTLTESEYPEEVMLPGYSHAYRWNKLEGEHLQFKEMWGYVLESRINDYNPETPLTDIGLFAAEIDCYGNMVNAPKRSLVKDFKGRVHLVAICESRSLTHFILSPEYKVRDKLVKDLIEAAKDFDGLQIDFELVPPKDGEFFMAFLHRLKKHLDGKELTVCLPARVKNIDNDVYSYKRIASVADRIMIMAYDEHWSTSAPGAVASIPWCERIMEYAKSVVPAERIIMGLPFYGRTWSKPDMHKAWAFNGINRIMHENEVREITRVDGVPSFEMQVTVNVTGYYDDATSILERCRMYKNAGYENIAFWRMGHEDTAIWKWLGTDIENGTE